MINNEQKSRESLIAAFLIILCLASVVIGGFLLNNNDKETSEENSSSSKIVESLMRDKVAVIALEGIIYDSMQSKAAFRTVYNAAYVKAELKKALEDKHTKAVLLRVNSPGGTVAASQEIYELVMDLRKKNKAVLVSMSDVCASGCYYIASAADHIVANRGTVTGSIGVISQSLNYKGLLEKLGVYDQTFKAGKFKDIGSGARTLSLEEKEILQALLNDSYDQFLSDIEAARAIDREELEKIAQGLIYTGRQALAKKLVDELGTYEDAKISTRRILQDKYNYDKSETIRFVETWNKSKLSSIDDIFDFSLGSKLADLGIFSKFFTASPENLHIQSAYQPVWMMP